MQIKLLNILAFIALIFLIIYISLSNNYKITSEDGIIEYLSAFFWLIGIILSIKIVISKELKMKAIAIVFLMICIISLGEEISWGQRVFNIRTPDIMVNANRQAEMNFHNLYIFSGGSCWLEFFKSGKFNIYQLTDAQNLFRIFFILFFLIFPILNKIKRFQVLFRKIGYYRPDNYFTLSIFLFLFVSCLIMIGKDELYLHSIQEIREMSYAIFIGFYLTYYFHYWRNSNNSQYFHSQ